MVNYCCVPECKFSDKSSKKSEPVALFRFPQKDMQYQYYGKNGLKQFLAKAGPLHKTIEYVLIISLKIILKLGQVITENHTNRLVQAKVWSEFA